MAEDEPVEEILARSVPLPNGLNLKLYDRSRPLVGDRWQVSLSARIEIPVARIESAGSGPSASEIRALLGSRLVFEQTRERNFIDHKMRKSVFEDLSQSLLSSLMGYVSRPDFAQRFVSREYQKRLTQLKWYKDLPENE